MFRLRLCILAAVLVPFTLAACAKNSAAPARVSGSISYKGQPIKAGAMAFHTSSGTVYPAQISPDGTYTATDIPEGEMVVTVETESVNPGQKAPQGKDADRRMKIQQQAPPEGVAASAPPPTQSYLKIPSKYANPKTSPLTTTVRAGRQVQNFDLTD